MTDHIPTPVEGAAGDDCDLTVPLVENADENRQITESQNNDSSTLPNIDTMAYNLGVRTVERSRIFAESISSTIERNLPLFHQETVCNI